MCAAIMNKRSEREVKSVCRHDQEIPRVDLKCRVNQCEPHTHRRSWGRVGLGWRRSHRWEIPHMKAVNTFSHTEKFHSSSSGSVFRWITSRVERHPSLQPTSKKQRDCVCVWERENLTFAIKFSLKVCSSNTPVCRRSVSNTHNH